MSEGTSGGPMTETLLTPRPRRLSRGLLARWEEELRAWEAPPASLERWKAIQDPRTRVVITGQQPGPWGGPLYALYKAATALALAERLTALDGVPTVAVFWVQAEDTDWGEVGWGALPYPDLRVFRHRFNAPLPARHWIGPARLQDPAEGETLVRAWSASSPFRDLLPQPEAYELGQTFIRGLLSFFGTEGLLPLDGRWPELRSDGGTVWERYIAQHRQLALEVVARGRERSTDGPAPLDEDASARGLFILDGEGRRPIDPAHWEKEASEMLAHDPARLAPSVLLRAPLQDHLLAPVVHVVGRTEAAYLDQLRPVYEAMNIEEPRRMPRLSATLLPRGLVPPASRDRAFADPEAWLRERAAAHLPTEAHRLLADLRRDLEDRTRRLQALLGEDQESREGIGSARRKIDFEIKRLEESLERRGRRELYRKDARLRHLAEFLRPRRGAQERGLSGGTLPLFFKEEAPSVLAQAARDHVLGWLAGRSEAIVLEAPHV